MKIVRDDDPEFRDDELHGSLRGLYVAPAEESYWASLERRIMARIQNEGVREWWSYFPGWVRTGLVAASIAVLIAGYAAWRTREAAEDVAYRELLDTPSELPILTESARSAPNARTRDATLRYLITR
jgi:cytochrome c-type biogenesis protein CcmH/NrfG